jgi:aminomethyltransferase
MSDTSTLKRTPLHGVHLLHNARMVDFGGWEMPLQYTGIIQEHQAVRTAVGLFDVSHMGEIEVRGPQALDLVNYVATNNAAKLQAGQAQYAGLLYETGCFVDDILVHKVSETEYFLCVNASNQDKDFEHIAALNRFDCEVVNAGPRYAQLAVQGPRALQVVNRVTRDDVSVLKYYRFTDTDAAGHPARVARTGYTGEDGFELYVAPEHAEPVWRALLAAGAAAGIQPCGLGARNTLRLEAAMALYGHEIDASITPLEAGLGWIVKFDKGDFVGRAALEKQQEAGIKRKLTGFVMMDRGIGRDGYEVRVDGEAAGWVTSGGPSPTLNQNIGLCYLPVEAAGPGRTIEIVIRDRPVAAVTVPIPFYKRPK